MLKYLLIGLILSGCSTDNEIRRIHYAAKLSNGTAKICYKILEPGDLFGKYCLEFQSEK